MFLSLFLSYGRPSITKIYFLTKLNFIKH